MNTIDLPMLLMLFNRNSPTDFWLSDCTMNDDGIKIRTPLTEEDGISGKEWMRYKQYEKEIQLDLPCTIKQFVDWAVLNHYDYILPTNDEELAEYAERNCFFSELPANLLREIKSALTPSEVNNQSDASKSNDFKPSGLLNNPKRMNDWFPVIDDMVKQFHQEAEKIPNDVQAWAQLCYNPPTGYMVSLGIGTLKDSLTMPHTRPLSHKAFKTRYTRYTAH